LFSTPFLGYAAFMPTVLRVGPYRFLFYAGDRNEAAHVHVERDDDVAKFWLDPVRLQRSGGISASRDPADSEAGRAAP